MAALIPRFDRITFIYKTINGHDLKAAVLVPKNLPPTKTSRPLLVHFHGGCLITGQVLEPYFLAEWVLELAEQKGAIVVSPEYRLLPEATGPDILEDIGDFWTWAIKELPTALAQQKPNVELDTDKVAVTGESAGGYLSVQSGLLFPEAKIRVVMAQYCAMHTDVEAYPCDAAKPLPAIVIDYQKKLTPCSIRTSTPFPEMNDFVLPALYAGYVPELMGKDERLTLEYGLRTAKEIPPLFVIQGTEDKIIPKHATDDMVARIRSARPEVPLHYHVQPGADHGFDEKMKLGEKWLAESMDFVGKYWP